MARFRVVPDKSAVVIEASSSLHPIHTRTVGLVGFLEVDVRGGRVDTSPDAKAALSFRVDRLSSGNLLEDRELHRRIDARHHPTIDGQMVLMSKASGVDRYRVVGDVTFRGVTVRCEDDVMITPIDDRTLRVEGASSFDVRDFGMEPPRILMLRVHPEVKVRIEVLAEKED